MNILVAVDSFKGSLSTDELADTIEKGIHDVSTHYIVKKIPLADGGEGTYETLLKVLGGKKVNLVVKGPLFNDIESEYGILYDNTAVIDVATSSGLPLVPLELRNPMDTTTFGLGQAISDAIDKGCRKFIIGIGGSSTNDAGIGMLAALGYTFLDGHQKKISPIGGNLNKIVSIDCAKAKKELKECEFQVACDVDNPLYGKNGAAHVFAKQKGATEEMIETLDKGLAHFSQAVKGKFNIDIANFKGGGAAGGLGAGFMGFLNAKLQPGIDIIFEKLKMPEHIKWADMVVTGEGSLDFQTIMGKAPMGISKLAKKENVPVIALAGKVTDDALHGHKHGITAMFSIMDSPMSLQEAMDKDNAKRLLHKQVYEVFMLISYFRHP